MSTSRGHPLARWLGYAVAGLAIAVAVLPLAGLIAAWRWPPPALFGAPRPTPFIDLAVLAARTLALAAVVAPAAVGLGTWLAWVGHRARSRALRALAAASLLPFATPSYLLAATLREALGPGGVLGALVGARTALTGFVPAALALIAACAPLAQLIVGAALRRIPVCEEEAARALGAGRWRTFATVQLPRLRPAWALALALSALYAIADFGAVAVLDCEVLTFRLYQAVQQGQLARAVELGLALLALAVPVLLAVRAVSGRAGQEPPRGRADAGCHRPLSALGAVAALAPLGFVLGAGLVVPAFVLGSWVVGGIRAGASLAPLGPVLGDALLLAAGGTAAILILALPLALGARPAAGGRGGPVEALVFLVSGLPGVLLGFGLVELKLALDRLAPAAGAALGAGAGYGLGDALERLGVLLVLGYAARYLATAHAALRPVALRVDPRWDEAARSLGASRLDRLRRVALPALAPGVGAAAVLVFVSLLKELPITLLLAPIGRRTLAYRAFDAYQQAALPEAGVAGLVLLALALGAQALTLRSHAER